MTNKVTIEIDNQSDILYEKIEISIQCGCEYATYKYENIKPNSFNTFILETHLNRFNIDIDTVPCGWISDDEYWITDYLAILIKKDGEMICPQFFELDLSNFSRNFEQIKGNS